MNGTFPIDELGRPAQFAWFHGVIEDVNDPEQLGRVRVRCIGYHTDNRIELPTSSLPWAYAMLPCSGGPAMSRLGVASTGMRPGTWVVGFFRDGPSAQDPIIMGTIASMSSTIDKNVGFSDPSGVNPVVTGPDIPREAMDDFASSASYMAKGDVQTGAPVDGRPALAAIQAPAYPQNQIVSCMTGGVIEIDSTPGKERVSITHKTGSHIDIDKDGNMIITSAKGLYVGSEESLSVGVANNVTKVATNSSGVVITTPVAILDMASSTTKLTHIDTGTYIELDASGNVTLYATNDINLNTASTPGVAHVKINGQSLAALFAAA